MTIGWKPNAAQKVHGARKDIEEARAELSALMRAFDSDVQAIRAKRDPDLSPSGQEKAHREAVERVQRAAEERVEAHLRTIADAEAVLQEVAHAEPAADAASVARREAHWRRAQSLLAAGRTAEDVIGLATDTEALLALREELPTYLRTRHVRPQGAEALMWSEPETDHVLSKVDRRLAEVGTKDVATFAKARLGLQAEVPLARTHVELVGKKLSGKGDPLGATLALAYAERAYASEGA